MKFLEKSWYGLEWTPWVNFLDKASHKLFPAMPGVYRVKPAGREELFYIGQTGRTLRERLQSLIRNTLQERMPFNDPHTAAPSLWAWRDAEKMEFEVSAAHVALPKKEREGLESCLLWLYRLERGESTACNHGRFHRGYEKSRDRSTGFRGGRLPQGESNPAGVISLGPLRLKSAPTSSDWMGLQWSGIQELTTLNTRKVSAVKAVYKIMGNELFYIGQTANLKTRLASHSKKNWVPIPAWFSYCILPDDTLPHQLKEWENDLIGAYFYQAGKVPKYQYAGQ